jgi:hypothetical protein
MNNTYDNLVEKWNPVLNEEAAGSITDSHKRSVTAALLENTEKALAEERQLTEAAPTNSTGANVANWDPILISLVRRAAPNMLAYDLAGVQPMSGPTGLIFAMKSKYTSQGGTEALFNEADTRFSGTQNSAAQPSSPSGLDVANANDAATIDSDRLTALAVGGMATDSAEALGDAAGNAFPEMGFSIEKATVTAKSRALKAEYSLELAQDLKAIHGLDAETELANILSTEILSEMNREVIRTINSQAKSGAQQSNVAVRGIFNMSTDADGRWSAEKFKGLMVQIEREANAIAKETRRGKGNVVMCSSDVASALAAAGMLDYAPAISANLNVDDTGNLFAGVLNGRTKVYIDPYATVDYVTVGYKGTNPYDAGVFYCPYVPLTMMRAVGEDTFQPKIGFKTRYGMVSNPFVGATAANGLATAKTNQYYRIFRVDNIMVSA